MYTPVEYNLCGQRRADFAFTLRLKDETGALKNLTGWLFQSSISTDYGAAIVDSFNVDTSQLASGEVTLSLTAAEMEALNGDYAFDVMARDGDSQWSKLLFGIFGVHDTVTDQV